MTSISNRPYYRDSQGNFLLFARGLVIPSASGPQLFDDCMASFQRECFADLAPSLHALQSGDAPPHRRFWVERTKKAGKDSDLAVCLLWLMAFPRQPIFCQVVAADQEQAGIVKRRVEEILFYNEWLDEYVKVQQSRILSINKLASTHVEASDKASAHGETPALLILNELVHVSKWQVMETHMNNANGVPRGVVIVSTNAGYKGTPPETWRRNALAKPDRWRMHVWSRMSPWLNEEDVKDAEATNTPSEFQRLWRGRWSSGKGDALDEGDIDRCFSSDLSQLEGPEEGWWYLAAVDLGTRKDHSGLLVLGVNVEERRLRVAWLKAWAPTMRTAEGKKEVDLDGVMEACIRVQELFNVCWFGYDGAEGGRLAAQIFRRRGMPMSEVVFSSPTTRTAMAECLMLVVAQGKLQCHENETLRRDLGKFNIVSKQPTGYRLEAVADEHGHADVGTALVMCLPQAMKMLEQWGSSQTEWIASGGDQEPLTEEEVEEMDPFLREIWRAGEEREEEHKLERAWREWGG